MAVCRCCSLDEAMGLLSLLQGNYNQAVGAYGNNRTNSRFGKTVGKRYNKAQNTLESVESSRCYYRLPAGHHRIKKNNLNDVAA